MLPLLLTLHHWLCIIRELLMMAIIQLRQIYGRVCERGNPFTHSSDFKVVCNEVQIDSSLLQRCLHQHHLN